MSLKLGVANKAEVVQKAYQYQVFESVDYFMITGLIASVILEAWGFMSIYLKLLKQSTST